MSITVITSPKSKLAAALLDLMSKQIGAVEANKWMFAANEAFGGESPVTMIKAGRHEEVAAFIKEMESA